MKTLTWQKPGQQNVAQELIKIIINYVAELRLNCLIGLLGTVLVIWFLGLDKQERNFIVNKLKRGIHQ